MITQAVSPCQFITHLLQKEQNEEAKDFKKSIHSKSTAIFLLILRAFLNELRFKGLASSSALFAKGEFITHLSQKERNEDNTTSFDVYFGVRGLSQTLSQSSTCR